VRPGRKLGGISVRRAYYDHEPAWQRIRESAGRGWDDRRESSATTDSYDALLSFLESPFCPLPPCRVLDLGCGGGQTSILLARRGYAVSGIDFAPTAIELARANARAAQVEVDFHIADCLDLSTMQAGTFDLAIDNHTLHCLIGDDRDRFVVEIAHLLRPGGVLFSETMSAEGPPEFERLGVDARSRIDQQQTRYWTTRDELLALLARAGFTIIASEARPQPGEDPYPGDTLVTIARAAPIRRYPVRA
jgi:2-polyprenyl-3-methyl-5-hydroxy-6-metoxy-1,4-benzoquinol methylase